MIHATYIHSFIHSGHFYSASSSPLLLRVAPDYSTDTISEFHAEAPQATVSKGLAQGPYVVARAGVELTTLRLRVFYIYDTCMCTYTRAFIQMLSACNPYSDPKAITRKSTRSEDVAISEMRDACDVLVLG